MILLLFAHTTSLSVEYTMDISDLLDYVAHERQSLLDTNAEEGETTLHVCMAGSMFSTASGNSLTSQPHAYWAVLDWLGQLKLQLRKVYFSDFSIPTRQRR